MIDLDPVRGHEQAGRRPALVLSVDAFNAGPAGLLMVAPITGTMRGIRWHVPVTPPEGGLDRPSAILCEQARTVAAMRLGRRMGQVSGTTLSAVATRLRYLLDL
jgi:mRNA interferase MazF